MGKIRPDDENVFVKRGNPTEAARKEAKISAC